MTHKLLKRALVVLLSVVSISIDAQEKPVLWYDKPAQYWEEALPLGNGRLGAMVYGNPAAEEIQLNEETVSAGSPYKNYNPEAKGALATIRQLIFAGRYPEAQELAGEKILSKNGFGMPYQTVGSLRLDFPGHENYINFRRELDLEKAVATTAYTVNGVDYKREVFTSFVDQLVIVRLTASQPGKLTFSASLTCPQKVDVTVSGKNALILEGTTKGDDFTKGAIRFRADLKLDLQSGKSVAGDTLLSVTNANSATIYIAMATNFVNYKDISGNPSERNKISMKNAGKNYARALQAHINVYQKYYNRVSLNLGRTSQADKPTDVRVKEFATSNDPHLVALYFQFGRYLLISSSQPGGQPANLQGIWNQKLNPAWKCRYTTNINAEMNYWPAEVANLSECYAPFITYVSTEALKDGGSWQQVARKENCRGWAVHTQNNIFGYTDWLINRPANAWYCTHLWQHYAYTLDKEYLRDTAWPVMKVTCQYWFDRLKENTEGRLVAPNEWSPEHGPWEDGVAYAQQLVYALFEETLAAAGVLAVDDAFVSELKEKFSRLDNGLHVGSWGQIKEWTIQEDKQGDHQRHLSHLMALYPCDQISYLKDKRYAEAAKVALDSRGDGATGWSRAWKVACWARLWDGERAYRLLKQAQNITDVTVVSMDDNAGGVYENLFCAHPSFQIDGNFGATAGIAEMMLQNTVKGVHLLPALPSAWDDGHFKGLKAKGGFVFDVAWKDGKMVEGRVHSAAGQECRMYLPDAKLVEVKKSKGGKVAFTQEADGAVVFPTSAGKSYRLRFE